MIKGAMLSYLLLLSLTVSSQERFNIRTDMGLLSNVCDGIVELENGYLAVGGGYLSTDTGIVYIMYSSLFDADGSLLEIEEFVKQSGNYLTLPWSGLTQASTQLESSMLGQTYDETTETAAGFMANFNEEGDTISVILFHSPYIEDYGEDFIAPLDIEPSTNADNSFFVSSNIFKLDGLTGTDSWIQRMTPDGETLWSYIYATEANPDNCKAMLHTEIGGVLLGVWEAGNDEVFAKFIELDSMGNELSEVTLETTNRINDLIINTSNEIFVATTSPNEEFLLSGSIAKYNINGEQIWELILSEPAPFGVFQEFTNIVHSQDDNYVVGGINYEYVTNPTDTSGTRNKNGWLVKINDDGDVIWDRKFHYVNSPSDSHTLNDLKATSDGGYIFCGEATDNDPDLEFSEGPPQQGWLVKVDEYGCLVEDCQLSDGINVIENDGAIEYFKAGPIPAGQFLNIYQSLNSPHGAIYQLIDMNGRVLEDFPAMSKGTTMMLDVSKYNSGTYLLNLMDGGKLLQSQKIIKQ
ncbi:MAG: hypothetical protein ACI897_000756 [Flavobacteriales bacterium]|jgi:hypothetical protein